MTTGTRAVSLPDDEPAAATAPRADPARRPAPAPLPDPRPGRQAPRQVTLPTEPPPAAPEPDAPVPPLPPGALADYLRDTGQLPDAPPAASDAADPIDKRAAALLHEGVAVIAGVMRSPTASPSEKVAAFKALQAIAGDEKGGAAVGTAGALVPHAQKISRLEELVALAISRLGVPVGAVVRSPADGE